MTTPTEICIECTAAGGKVLKQCTCSALQVRPSGLHCLVCRDASGTVAAKTCP